jgi:tungstate transport system ATP-binding protein
VAAGTILPLVLDDLCLDAGGRRLIDGVSTRIEAATRTLVLGPNGAGKSLTLRLCHGLIAPTAGRVLWLGANGVDVRGCQAMVFQRPVMLRRSAAANVGWPLALRGGPAAARRARVADMLARVGLARLAGQPARRLSVGEQQKLALARAWALDPHVLFLDEPTASLDPAATHAVEGIIAAIHAGGTKIVMTTHDLAQARRLADDVVFLHGGRLLEHTPAATFFAAPRSREAAAFLDGTLTW